jgi:hypothetical protein
MRDALTRLGQIAAVASVVLVLGCNESSSANEPNGATSHSSAGVGGSGATGAASTGAMGGAGGSAGVAGAGGESCAVNELDLEVTQFGGVPSRIFVPVTYEDRSALFLLDTGSALTFLRLGPDDPDYVAHAGDATVGCITLSLPGRGGLAPADDEFGLPVVGTLGADFLIGGASLLDAVNGKLVRRPLGDVPPETSNWASLDYDDVLGHVIAPVELDATAVRLMLDTGSPDILWLGQQGQPGDFEVTTEDAEGTELTLYYGSVVLEMADRAPVDVPVLRAPSFPYFEQTVAALGGNIHGLLGLSAFRGRALLFDGAAHRVLLGPVR